MTATYRIQPCTLADLRAMSVSMRAMDRSEIEGAASLASDLPLKRSKPVGLKVRHALIQVWRNSPDPRAAYVDRGEGWEIAAVWGDEGHMLEALGRAWLFTAPAVAALPLAFFRETRREVRERLEVRRVLKASVRDDYAQAIRFFRLLGFTVSEAVALPPFGILYRELRIERPVVEVFPAPVVVSDELRAADPVLADVADTLNEVGFDMRERNTQAALARVLLLLDRLKAA